MWGVYIMSPIMHKTKLCVENRRGDRECGSVAAFNNPSILHNSPELCVRCMAPIMHKTKLCVDNRRGNRECSSGGVQQSFHLAQPPELCVFMAPIMRGAVERCKPYRVTIESGGSVVGFHHPTIAPRTQTRVVCTQHVCHPADTSCLENH